jgi:phenylacetaldehyde dehydrogenase
LIANFCVLSVFPDADVKHAISGTASAIFFNHGQCCCAGSRLFVHEKLFDQLVEGVSKVASDIKLAPGMDPSCQMGPLVSEEQYRKVLGYIDSGISDGAKVAAGGAGGVLTAATLCGPRCLAIPPTT